MASQKTPREEREWAAGKDIAFGLARVIHNEPGTVDYHDAMMRLAKGIADALSLLRGEQEAERGR